MLGSPAVGQPARMTWSLAGVTTGHPAVWRGLHPLMRRTQPFKSYRRHKHRWRHCHCQRLFTDCGLTRGSVCPSHRWTRGFTSARSTSVQHLPCGRPRGRVLAVQTPAVVRCMVAQHGKATARRSVPPQEAHKNAAGRCAHQACSTSARLPVVSTSGGRRDPSICAVGSDTSVTVWLTWMTSSFWLGIGDRCRHETHSQLFTVAGPQFMHGLDSN